MLRDAVHLGITPYGPDQGWTIGGPIDLGARGKTLHPLVFGPFGDFPLWIRWGGVHGVCPLAGPGPKLPRAMNSTPFGGGSTRPYPSHGLAMIEDSGALSTRLQRHPLLGGHHAWVDGLMAGLVSSGAGPLAAYGVHCPR